MSDEGREKLTEGTLISHLLELRTRLMRAVLVVVLIFIPCAIYANDLFQWLSAPLLAQLPTGGALIATSVMSPFTAPLKLSFMVAVFIGMPYVLFEAWGFVAPGLYRHEKRFAIPLLLSSIVLFYTGIAFVFFLLFPVIFKFFAATAPAGVQMMTDINNYLGFVLTLFFAFGVAFEVPVVVVLLAATGMVSVAKLKSSRGYVIIGIFVIAAVLTPPDALTQTAMALPMWFLYEAGIMFATIVQKARRERELQRDADDAVLK